jgi:membrane protease YdiL (CAAX protease family)
MDGGTIVGEIPQPPLDPAGPPRIWTVALACLLLFFGMAFVSAASLVLDGVARPAGAEPGLPWSSVPGLVGLAAATTALIAGLALVPARLSAEGTRARLGLVDPRVRGWGLWLVAIAGGLALSQAVDFALRLSGFGRGLSLEHVLGVLRQARGPGLALAVLVLGVGAGTAEELFFRGYVQRRLVARFGPVIGISVAAFLFALAHLNPQHSAFAFVFGLYLGGLALWCGSTWPAIAVHVVNNATAVLLAATGVDDANARLPVPIQVGLLLGLALAAAGAAAWIRRQVRR